MASRCVVIVVVMCVVSFSGVSFSGVSLIPAYAVQLDVSIPMDSKEFIPSFDFVRIISIQYEKDSRLAELVGNTQKAISFEIDSENNSTLIEMINSELQKKSFVRVTDINGKYSATITPQEQSVTIEYKILLHPTMSGHFIGDSILDSQWRGFEILGEIPIQTVQGTYDINSPKSVFVMLPELLEYLSDSDIEILDLKLVDTSGLGKLPLSKWESIFDPTSKMSQTKEFGFSGGVITNYSMGICTIYLGMCQDKDYLKEITINGEIYTIRSIESQDDGTIVIEGYVQESIIEGIEVFTIASSAPSVNDTDNGQIPMVYAVSGIGVVAAIGFFVWSDKKSKKTSTEQSGIDPKDLCAIPIGEYAGSYQTNRATAQLR